MSSTLIGLIFTFLTGFAGALYSLHYKFKERNACPTDPVMFFFSLSFVLVTAVILYLFKEPVFCPEALLLGIPFGIVMCLALRLYFLVTTRAKLNISWLIIQFSLLIPFSLSILVYRETLELRAIIGIVLIFSSIIFFGVGKGSSGTRAAIPDTRTWLLLALSSLFSGLGMAVPRVYVSLNPEGGAFTLAFYQGLTLLVLNAAVLLIRWNKNTWEKAGGVLLIGSSMGATAVPTTVFITLALMFLRGAIVYPLRSVINVLCVFVLSFLLFKEKVRVMEAVGSLLALAGIVLVSATLS
jgi:drug/metabolite transporter (DMT)-like permease